MSHKLWPRISYKARFTCVICHRCAIKMNKEHHNSWSFYWFLLSFVLFYFFFLIHTHSNVCYPWTKGLYNFRIILTTHEYPLSICHKDMSIICVWKSSLSPYRNSVWFVLLICVIVCGLGRFIDVAWQQDLSNRPLKAWLWNDYLLVWPWPYTYNRSQHMRTETVGERSHALCRNSCMFVAWFRHIFSWGIFCVLAAKPDIHFYHLFSHFCGRH